MKTILLILTLWKYSLRGCLQYRISFLMQAGFMVFNNAILLGIFILFFSHFRTIGGMTFETWLPFYTFAVIVFGVVHTFFYGYSEIAPRITEGRLDNDLLTPKSPLLKILTKDMSFSAIGDILSGLLFLGILAPQVFADAGFVLRLLIAICIATMVWVGIMIFYHSLSFWIGSSEWIADAAFQAMLGPSLYPPAIFEGTPLKWILLTIFPAYFAIYYPQALSVSNWDLGLLGLSLAGAVGFVDLGVFTFYRGLRRYESGNMMVTNV